MNMFKTNAKLTMLKKRRFAKWFLNPFALSVRRSASKTNVSKGTGNSKLFLINIFSLDLSFDTFLLRKNTQDERSF